MIIKENRWSTWRKTCTITTSSPKFPHGIVWDRNCGSTL